MDSSLSKYKTKLEEALVLVQPMSQEKKVEAVSYWNNAAQCLHDILHPIYDEPVLDLYSDIKTSERAAGYYPNHIEGNEILPPNSIHCNLDTTPSCSTDDSRLITPQILSTSVDDFHIDGHPEKSPFEGTYLESAAIPVIECEEPNSTDDTKWDSKDKQNTCEVCGKSGFSTKGNLKRHLRAHSGEKPFKCDICDSCFTEKKSLKIHVRRHTGEKPYKCELCGKLFSQTGVLNSHMALHSDERNFICHKCGRAFRQRSQLNLHLMRHDGVKRLECPTCMAKFLTKGDLERHRRIHTGERPYACKMCTKSFTRQQSLNEHMNRHTGRRPYDCKYCDKTFSEMSACYKHAKTHRIQDQLKQRQYDKSDYTPAI